MCSPRCQGWNFEFARRRRIERRDFYAVIRFQRKRNFAETRSSRQDSPGSQRFLFFPPIFFSAVASLRRKKKNIGALNNHFLIEFLDGRSSLFYQYLSFVSCCFTFVNLSRRMLEFRKYLRHADIQDSFVRVLFFFISEIILPDFPILDGTPAWIRRERSWRLYDFYRRVHSVYTFKISPKRFGHVTALWSNTCDWKNLRCTLKQQSFVRLINNWEIDWHNFP